MHTFDKAFFFQWFGQYYVYQMQQSVWNTGWLLLWLTYIHIRTTILCRSKVNLYITIDESSKLFDSYYVFLFHKNDSIVATMISPCTIPLQMFSSYVLFANGNFSKDLLVLLHLYMTNINDVHVEGQFCTTLCQLGFNTLGTGTFIAPVTTE